MNTPTSAFSAKIKIFLDGADRAQILEFAPNSKVHGFTTNPSLMKKAGVTNYPAFCQEILAQVRGKPISFEVFADEFPEMKRQALAIAAWEKGVPGSNLYVKIPIMNSKGESAIPLVRELSQQGVKLNVTAIYTIPQVVDTCQAVREGAATIVSVFAGRIADTGRDPMPTMTASAEICRSTGSHIELLWASTREALNIVQAEQAGCAIITSPADMIRKMSGFGKDLLEVSRDTVKQFKADAEAAGFSL